MNGTVLVHYGIKGMKWGRRKASTDIAIYRPGPTHGRKVKPVTTDDMQQRIKEQGIRNKYEKMTYKQGKLEKTKSGVDAAGDIVRIGKGITGVPKQQGPKLLDTSHLSDAELQKKIQRMNMERQYATLMQKPEEISVGKQRVNQALEVAGGVLATTGAVLSIAMAVKEIRKGS